MIAGLERVLEGSSPHGRAELGAFLERLVGDGAPEKVRIVGHDPLGARARRVFRLRLAAPGRERSVVVKHLQPAIARRTEMVARRWLPALDLAHAGPPLIGSAADAGGCCVWQVYEDLGDGVLDPAAPDRERVRAAVTLVARLHTRFASHPLLGEVRLHGGDRGIHFYEDNVRDARGALAAWTPRPADRGLRDRLAARLDRLLEELPRRRDALHALGGPETLLHGDLWAINIFVTPTPDGQRARLIDWDHAAVGPAGYDLSTLLLRFPAGDRPWILALYERAVAPAGWRLPAADDLNFMYETHELARFANRIIWPAIALLAEPAGWGVPALEEIEGWFEAARPVLPAGIDAPARAARMARA